MQAKCGTLWSISRLAVAPLRSCTFVHSHRVLTAKRDLDSQLAAFLKLVLLNINFYSDRPSDIRAHNVLSEIITDVKNNNLNPLKIHGLCRT